MILTTLYTYISVEKNTNKSWVIDGTMIIEEYLGTSDGAARSPPLFRGLVTLENGINPDTHHVDAVVCFDRTSNSITVSFSRPLVSAFLAPGAGFMAVVIASKIVKSTILL